MHPTDGGAWQLAQRVMDGGLTALRASLLAQASWNALMTLPILIVFVGTCPVSAALFEALPQRGVMGPAHPVESANTARLQLFALMLAFVLTMSVLTTLHRAVAIVIAREPEGATVRSGLTRIARHATSLLVLGAALGAIDAVSLALASAVTIVTGSSLAFVLVVLGFWLATRPSLGACTAALIDRGTGGLGAIAASHRALAGRRLASVAARVLWLVVTAGTLALLVGVPFFGLMGLAMRGSGSGGVWLLASVYVLLLPWLVMHLASLEAALEWKLYERSIAKLDPAGLARTFE